MKNIYEPYLGKINQALQRNKFQKGLSSFTGISGFTDLTVEGLQKSFEFGQGLLHLANRMNISPGTPGVGNHPDFNHLIGSRKSERYNIISSFFDIKGSTNLHLKYDLEEIEIVTNTIQQAAIDTCLAFGGHIQRLEGDGLFVYFGGKSITETDAVRNCLIASSVFTYFIKNDLRKLFELQGIENIYTRVGIDVGKTHKDVLWTVTGTSHCYELTTLSLHTSLAKKIQAFSKSNGIMIGENINTWFPEASQYSVHFTDDLSLERKFNYKSFDFDWFRFFKRLPFIVQSNGEYEFDVPSQTESEKLTALRNTTSLLSSGGAFTDKAGLISSDESGVRNQPHRFHFDDQRRKEK